uniref:Uncharacterized protein n=1 Tax=Arundo donax TaxID=35708 RepID=A0A0A8YPR2_ARUDO
MPLFFFFSSVGEGIEALTLTITTYYKLPFATEAHVYYAELPALAI